MKKNKSNKELSRLRAEVEILKSRLKDESPDIIFRKVVEKTSITSPNTKIEPTASISTTDLRRDLTKTLLLTMVSLSFIFLLKVAIIPNQRAINQKATELYSAASSILNKAKPQN